MTDALQQRADEPARADTPAERYLRVKLSAIARDTKDPNTVVRLLEIVDGLADETVGDNEQRTAELQRIRSALGQIPVALTEFRSVKDGDLTQVAILLEVIGRNGKSALHELEDARADVKALENDIRAVQRVFGSPASWDERFDRADGDL